MTAKARLVMKDLKARRKLDPIQTCAAVPQLYGIRLMLALTNQLRYIKSTCDLVTAYLQQEEWDQGSWMLIKWRDPFTNEWVYAWLRGETSRPQDESADRKHPPKIFSISRKINFLI